MFPEHTTNLPKISERYTEYLIRLQNLQAACVNETSQQWLSSHMQAIDGFRAKIEKIIHPYQKKELVDNNRRANSAVSRSSRVSSSTLSSIRVKMAEKKLKQELTKQLSKRSLLLNYGSMN